MSLLCYVFVICTAQCETVSPCIVCSNKQPKSIFTTVHGLKANHYDAYAAQIGFAVVL